MIERLVRARLLAITDDRVEVIHEALFTSWPKLVAWRLAHDADARLRDQLGEAARQWDTRGRPRGLLWRDDALAEYRTWRMRWRESPTGVDKAFGDASEAEARRTRRTRALAIAAVGIALASGIVVLYRARAAAERQNRTLLAEQAIHELASDHSTRALPYLVELLRAGEDTPANRFLVAEGVRPLDAHDKKLLEVDDGLSGIVLSSDGTLLASTDFIGTARVFASDGGPISTMTGHRSLALTPTFMHGDAWLVTSSDDGDIRVWDVATGQTLRTMHNPHGGWIAASGDRAAMFMADATWLWDVASGVRLAMMPKTGPVVMSADAARIAALTSTGASLFDATTGAPTATLAIGTTCSVSYGHAARHLALSCGDRTVRIYDDDTPRVTIRAVATENPSVWWSGDDTRIVTASPDALTKVWDTSSGELLAVFGVRAFGAALDRTGSTAATLGPDNMFRVFDVATGQLHAAVETEITGGRAAHGPPGVQAVLLSPDGSRLYTESATRLDLWHADQTAVTLAFPLSGANSVGVSPDRRLIAVGGGDGRAEVHDANTGALVRTLPALGVLVYDANFSPDGRRIVLAGIDNGARIIDADNTVHVLTAGTVNRASFSPTGAQIVTAGSDPNARIWDAQTGALVRTLAGHTARVMSASWSPDGTRIATTGWDQTVRIWDAATGAPLSMFLAPNTQFLDVTWSPDGTQLAAGGHSGELILWDVETGARRLLLGHAGALSNVSWSPDGALIASSSTDLTLRIWDVDGGRLLATRTGFRGSVDACTWIDNGRVATASEDSLIRVWDVHRDTRPVAELADLVDQHVPWRLVDGRLVPADR